ncbi:exocyst complex component, exo70 subunit [Pleurotus eryngii]|uniref:Exocyst complex protein EXO70 n=1 Tax=Pleurotus eryngii TaxID=5323 RepID=A0A9P5ZMQ4_PLEER|nr:exocyst complex component, exo70 subunit [Pleurotus eryngii]
MDDESAEIELLEQNLNKTHQISQRMISILNSFDTRLAKLEKSILPLYSSTQILNKRASNIEKALLKIDEVASNQEGIAAEEALILRGPQSGQLDVYTDALERLNAGIAFKSSDRDLADTARLVETGAKKLTLMYTKLVAEGSSGSTPPPGADLRSAPFPTSLLTALDPVVSFLRSLPLPATHPSHPAAPSIMSTLKDAQRGYADMRGTWSCKCLETQAKRVLDRADTIDSILAGKEFGDWVESLITIADQEYEHLKDLSPLVGSAVLASTYTTLLNPISSLFGTTLQSLISFIKRSLHKHAFLALSSHEALISLKPRWDVVLSRRGSDPRGDSNDPFTDGLQSIRAVSLRSFPEFLADLKMASLGKGGEVGTGLAEFVVSTVQYLDRLPEVQSAAGSALLKLGDGNWKMGEGVLPTAAKASKLGEGDESLFLEHFVYDVIITTVNSLTTLSRAQRRPSMGSILLLNNISYLRQRIILEPRNEGLSDLLSKPTLEAINSNFRTAKAAYFDSNFSPLMQALTDDPKEKGGKAVTKEKFTRFFDLLEEVVERHKLGKALEDDEEGRETLADEVVKLVVPSLQRFTSKHREKEFSKNIKLSADGVETQLRSIYR